MNIRKDDYVRTNYGIFKISDIEIHNNIELFFVEETGILPDEYLVREEIKKVGVSKAELVEVGDYIDGQKVEAINQHACLVLMQDHEEEEVDEEHLIVTEDGRCYHTTYEKIYGEIITKEQIEYIQKKNKPKGIYNRISKYNLFKKLEKTNNDSRRNV